MRISKKCEWINLKEWRKLQWTKNRAFIGLRFADLYYIGLKVGKPYVYATFPSKKKLIIKFKRGEPSKENNTKQ